ncbi:unnamed protein product [Protopolystoma xenopodis]|uniref:Winged helix Storkhead-box1 domain-containing protein n=1 Tax=Protopolystoma xenopodis TaxID=117903 RepID=A0A448WQV4_9PLAT|nr:unnamed protein product [Protopolystoma xenopodis]
MGSFIFLFTADAGNVIVSRALQHLRMRPEEIICQVIWQVTQMEPTCTFERLSIYLGTIYRNLQQIPPSQQKVKSALQALIKSNAIYDTG